MFDHSIESSRVRNLDKLRLTKVYYILILKSIYNNKPSK